jgi:hypothetical protein
MRETRRWSEAVTDELKFRFARDSPLEGGGFEPSVPRGCNSRARRRKGAIWRLKTHVVGTGLPPLRLERYFGTGGSGRGVASCSNTVIITPEVSLGSRRRRSMALICARYCASP